MTDCTQRSFYFPEIKKRVVELNFEGGDITSDGGALLLRQADRLIGLSKAHHIDKIEAPELLNMIRVTENRSSYDLAQGINSEEIDAKEKQSETA